jgi:hypothetical protein
VNNGTVVRIRGLIEGRAEALVYKALRAIRPPITPNILIFLIQVAVIGCACVQKQTKKNAVTRGRIALKATAGAGLRCAVMVLSSPYMKVHL